MERVGAVVTHRLEVVGLEDVEHLQYGDALAVGGQFEDIVATVGDGERLDPVALVGGEVLLAQIAADPPHVGVDHPGDLTPVERIAAALGDPLVGPRQVRVAEDLAFFGRFAAGHVGGTRVVELLDLGGVPIQQHQIERESGADHLGDRKPFLRVADRRCQDLRHRQLAELAVQLEPAVDRSRHRYRQHAHIGDFLGIAEALAHFGE